MTSKIISVPDYVADSFNKSLGNENALSLKDGSVKRIFRLINEALQSIAPADWEINGTQYHSFNRVEPYGFHQFDEKFCIYAEERGQRSALAVFKSGYLAADYFVWLVSKGLVQIDWRIFLDMEP